MSWRSFFLISNSLAFCFEFQVVLVVACWNLIDNNKVFTIVDNKLVSKEMEVVQIFEENAIVKGLKNNDRILSEPIKGSFNGMQVRFNK